MDKKPKDKLRGQHNESEGNTSAARHYNNAQRQSVRSGKVNEETRDAAKRLSNAERAEIENAELVGERHIAEADPGVKGR